MFVRWLKALSIIGLICGPICVASAYAQQTPPGTTDQRPGISGTNSDQRVTNAPPVDKGQGAQPSDAASQTEPKAYVTYKTPYEFWLTGLTIALVVCLAALLCIMAGLGRLTPEFYKAFLILIVVFSALFLIVAGYTDQQTAPVFSLLGTIAGYIFGRSTGGAPGDTTSDGQVTNTKAGAKKPPPEPAPADGTTDAEPTANAQRGTP
jgi:hypothetical protein